MGLTVVTHTNPDANRDISMCVESVAAALPPGARHLIIECLSHAALSQARVDAIELDDFITFVDDDDYITENSLSNCMSALDSGKYGVAFTREKTVTEKKSFNSAYATTYDETLRGCKAIHHLSVIRTSAVTNRGKDLALKLDSGNEWVIKLDAGFNNGIVHIPEIGYYWRLHENQRHRLLKEDHIKQITNATKEVSNWNRPTGKIPIWVP